MKELEPQSLVKDTVSQSGIWKPFDKQNLPHQFNKSDRCYHLAHYYKYADRPEDTFSGIIRNFKKTIDKKGKPEWYYRNESIKSLSHYMKLAIPNSAEITIVAVPCSKKKDSKEYDNRFEDLLMEFTKHCPAVKVASPLEIKEEMLPAHYEGSRNYKRIMENYTWKGFNNEYVKELIILDDVATGGGHYRATADFILKYISQKHPPVITGLFFGRTMEVVDLGPPPEEIE